MRRTRMLDLGSASAPTIVDTNLLLLLMVGFFDISRIGRFKRTSRFSAMDFQLLVRFLEPVRRIVTTPHILTEVSNLAGQMDRGLWPRFYLAYAKFIQRLDELSDLNAKAIVATDLFRVFGLTDAVIAAVGSRSIRVLTDDLPLASALSGKGINVVVFDVLRNMAGLH